MPQPRTCVGEQRNCVWWWEERWGDEQAIQYYDCKMTREALCVWKLSLRVEELAPGGESAVAAGYQSAPGGKSAVAVGYQSASKGTVVIADEGDLMWEIVKVVAKDKQITSWAEDRGRTAGVSKCVKMRELATMILKDVVRRSRGISESVQGISESVQAIKRLMDTDEAI